MGTLLRPVAMISAHGFQLGPGAGAVMAEIIATGRSNVPIDGLDIARFTPVP